METLPAVTLRRCHGRGAFALVGPAVLQPDETQALLSATTCPYHCRYVEALITTYGTSRPSIWISAGPPASLSCKSASRWSPPASPCSGTRSGSGWYAGLVTGSRYGGYSYAKRTPDGNVRGSCSLSLQASRGRLYHTCIDPNFHSA